MKIDSTGELEMETTFGSSYSERFEKSSVQDFTELLLYFP